MPFRGRSVSNSSTPCEERRDGCRRRCAKVALVARWYTAAPRESLRWWLWCEGVGWGGGRGRGAWPPGVEAEGRSALDTRGHSQMPQRGGVLPPRRSPLHRPCQHYGARRRSSKQRKERSGKEPQDPGRDCSWVLSGQSVRSGRHAHQERPPPLSVGLTLAAGGRGERWSARRDGCQKAVGNPTAHLPSTADAPPAYLPRRRP